jgi:hypothetical protein
MFGKLLKRRRDRRDVDYSTLNYMTAELPQRDPAADLAQVQDEQINLLMGMVERQAVQVSAARHLMDVMALRSLEGNPVFQLADGGEDPTSVEMIRHAVVDLWAKLDGHELPEFLLPERTH